MAKFGGRFEPDAKDKEIARLRDLLDLQNTQIDCEHETNERLRAELEALRPKPVVEVIYMTVHLRWATFYPKQNAHSNLKLTYHDGVLVSAEVINQGEVK